MCVCVCISLVFIYLPPSTDLYELCVWKILFTIYKKIEYLYLLICPSYIFLVRLLVLTPC